MPNRLIDINKVGIFCDGIAHSTEKRKDGETKVVQLTLRIQPFDSKLASQVRQDVRQTLFRLNTAEPHPHLERVNFKLGVPRQDLEIFASSDTRKASILIQGCKISGVYARTEKDANMLAFVVKASFGPASKNELEYVEDWRNGQRWVTFTESDPSFQFEEVVDEGDEDDDAPERPREMWADGDEQNPNTAAGAEGAEPEPARHAAPRHADRKSAAKAKQGNGRTH